MRISECHKKSFKKEDFYGVQICAIWRRRRDLNSRAGCPTYTLSRGASSPLEYFSVWERLLPMDDPYIC